MILSDTERKFIVIRCECGVETMEIQKERFGEANEYFISISTQEFYSKQRGIMQIIKDRLKFVWFALSGKEYRLMELILTEEDFSKFKELVNEM